MCVMSNFGSKYDGEVHSISAPGSAAVEGHSEASEGWYARAIVA